MAAPPALASLAPALEQLRDYAGWWLGELAAMLPAALRPRPAVVLADLGADGELRLGRLDRAGWRPLPGAPPSGLPVWLRLPAEAVLTHRTDWPDLPPADLRRAARLDLDRQTPLPAAALWFDIVPVARDPARRRVTAALAVAPAALVEETLARLRGAHGVAAVARVGVAGAAEGLDFDLRPAEAGAAPPQRVGLRRWLLLACVLLGLLNLGLYALREADRADQLAAQVAEARGRVQRLDALRTQLDEKRRLRDSLALRRGGIPLLAVLEELTRRLPDDVVLDTVEIRAGMVQLTGLAAAPPQLVATLEASPLFTEAQFRTPFVADRGGGRERFDMALRLRGAP